MATLTFDDLTSKALKWVLSGADNSDYGHYIIISIDKDGFTKLSTNTPFGRSLEMQAENTEGEYSDVAFAASTLSGLAKSVEEGDQLTLNIDNEKDVIYISLASTTITVDNLYDVCPVVASLRGKTTLTTVDASSVAQALTTATKMLPKNGDVAIDCDSNRLTVSAISSELVSREEFPSTLPEGEESHILVSGKKLSPLNAVVRTGIVEDMKIKEERGVVSFVFPIHDDSIGIDALSMNVSTAVENYNSEGGEFLDDEEDEIATLSISEVKEALAPLTAVVSDANVTIDTTGAHGVSLTITSKGTAAKTIVLDAEVASGTTHTVSLPMFMAALKNISTAQVIISSISVDGKPQWYILTPDHGDDDNPGEDLIVAIPLK